MKDSQFNTWTTTWLLIMLVSWSITTNRMEIYAVIAGLSQLKEPCEVTVYSDSAYTVNAFNEKWLAGWIRSGWKKADGKPHPAIPPLDLWLHRYGVQDKDAEPEPVSRTESIRRRAEQRRRLKAMQPEAKLDLHGLTQEEAEHSLDSFFRECRQKGLRKILIVHGKGLHSEGQPVLFSVVRSYLERNPFAGDFGQAAKEDGGSGALWVILKQD